MLKNVLLLFWICKENKLRDDLIIAVALRSSFYIY